MNRIRIKNCVAGFVFNLILVGTGIGEVTLSEIMFDPLGNENYEEFVEIYNTGPDSVDLTGWQLSDQAATDLLLPVTGSTMKLAPQAFAIILDPGYFENSTVYDALIPEKALRLTLDNATFGSGGLSNSTAKNIQLLNAANTEISAYQYSLGNAHGYSDEKINLTGPNSADNWADSQVLHGTPGFFDRFTPVHFDLSLSASRIRKTPPFPEVGERVQVRIPVLNMGQVPAEKFTVILFWDENRNGAFEAPEEWDRQNNARALAPGDSTAFDFTWNALQQGSHSLLAEVISAPGENPAPDENPANDRAAFAIIVFGPPPEVMINEIMFRPLTGEPEWFEIFNRGAEAVNLRDWKFSDSRVSSKIWLRETDWWLAPHGFVVVAANNTVLNKFPEIDSVLVVPASFPALNNDGDAVVLWDLLGRQIDSVRYLSGWSTENGISLERKSPVAGSNAPESWGSSQAEFGATPGARNSWLPPAFDLGIGQIQLTPARAVAPTEISIEVQIENTGENSAAFQLTLFEDLNENQQFDPLEMLVAPLPGNEIGPGASTSVRALVKFESPGVRFLGAFLETALDLRPANNLLIQKYAVGFPEKSLVINEFLHKPAKGFAEWIELFNPTNRAISIRDWTLTDAEFQHQVKLTESRQEIEPGQFLILANSSSFFQQFPTVTCPVIILANLPVLNNDADEIVLMDCAGFTMDSLAYTSSWVTETGVSLERVFWRRNSVNPANWKPAQSPAGATPGAPNSVEALDFDLALFSGAIQIYSQPLRFSDSIQVVVKIENPGKETVPGFGMNFFNNTFGDSLLGEPVARVAVESTIPSGDFLKIEVVLPPSEPGRRWLIGEIDLPEDNSPENNFLMTELRIGFPPGSLVINEIMYSPFAGQAEWIEVFNPGSATVDVDGWQIADDDGSEKVWLSGPCRIPPQGFAIIAGDSSFFNAWPETPSPLLVTKQSFPALNNEAEQVWLFDLAGSPIDSVVYSAAWGGAEGISLERINPAVAASEKSNWNSCVFPKGGSPGQQNSIRILSLPAQAGLVVSPDPFSPDNDGFDDFAAIAYDLPLATSRVNLKIFDIRGRLVRTLLNSEPGSARRTIFWDGKDDQNQIARMGIYIIYLEALNEIHGSLTTVTKTVVLANRLD